MALLVHRQPRRLFASAVVGATVSLACTNAANAAISCVAPPVLSAPLSYNGLCPGDSGFPTTIKAGGRDVYVKMPTNRSCSRGLTVEKPRNLRITGGSMIFNDSTVAVITVRDTSGDTMIDGMYIDVKGKAADAIRTFNNKGRMTLQNTYIKGISGVLNGTHGDLLHAQNGGPLAELTLQNVTGLTGYQGLFSPYRPDSGHGTRKLRLDRVNVGYDPGLSKSSGAGKPLMLLYIGSADNGTDRVPDLGTTLSGVYVDGSYWAFPYYKAIYAYPSGTANCTSFDAKHKISGQICGGKPTDYAPAGQVGASYNRANFCY
jgi:hypothetical protein